MSNSGSPVVPVTLQSATWLPKPHPQFWECGACPAAHGGLGTREHAKAAAVAHMEECHGGMPEGAMFSASNRWEFRRPPFADELTVSTRR